MRFLNGFVLIGIILLFISIGGAASGNKWLTEPGQQPNPYAWLEYLGAAVLMLVNGAISINVAAKNRPPDKKDSKEKSSTDTAADKQDAATDKTAQ